MNKLSFPACFSCHVFPFLHLNSFPLCPLCHTSPSIHPSIFLCRTLPCFVSPAPSPSFSPKIFHLKNLENAASHQQSRSPSPTHSASSSSSLSSSSFSSCWYSPSVWPSCVECCHYILRALVATYLLLFFASSFLVFFSDPPATCHHGPHHTLTQGPAPHLGVPRPSMDPTDSQCKSVSPPSLWIMLQALPPFILTEANHRCEKRMLKMNFHVSHWCILDCINRSPIVTLHVASHYSLLLSKQKTRILVIFTLSSLSINLFQVHALWFTRTKSEPRLFH